MKPSEYGGSDTLKTLGIQPAPHTKTASEQLRVFYAQDPVQDVELRDPTEPDA